MMKLRFLFAFLWLLVVPSHSQTLQVSGAWCQTGIQWTKPPAELHRDERSAEAALLYFGPNSRFALIYGIVIQGSNWATLSHGDGQTVYLGTWTLDGTVIRIQYQLVSKTFLREGDKLPGPRLNKTVQSAGGVLLFEKMRFRRDKRLDDQLLAVLQGESASRGRKGPP
jgi:hypothetical protein